MKKMMIRVMLKLPNQLLMLLLKITLVITHSLIYLLTHSIVSQSLGVAIFSFLSNEEENEVVEHPDDQEVLTH